MTLPLEWHLSADPGADIGFAIAGAVGQISRELLPDLADLFPMNGPWELLLHLDNGWLGLRITQRHGSALPSVGKLEDADVARLKAVGEPCKPHSHSDLVQLLGTDWFSAERFTYIGPYRDQAASWFHLRQHLIDWLKVFVLPEVFRKNEARVLRAIPSPPQFDLRAIEHALWVLECEETVHQGTAFALDGVGLITCQHVLGTATHAFRPDTPARKYPVTVRSEHTTIDLAILSIMTPMDGELQRGTADHLRRMDHVAIAGFPNYRLGDTGIIVPGLVVGFRMVAGIRRILTNAPIVAGNSGGPVLDSLNRVIGVAVTGADCMERIQETENHGIIPIDALGFLTPSGDPGV